MRNEISNAAKPWLRLETSFQTASPDVVCSVQVTCRPTHVMHHEREGGLQFPLSSAALSKIWTSWVSVASRDFVNGWMMQTKKKCTWHIIIFSNWIGYSFVFPDLLDQNAVLWHWHSLPSNWLGCPVSQETSRLAADQILGYLGMLILELHDTKQCSIAFIPLTKWRNSRLQTWEFLNVQDSLTSKNRIYNNFYFDNDLDPTHPEQHKWWGVHLLGSFFRPSALPRSYGKVGWRVDRTPGCWHKGRSQSRRGRHTPPT